MEYADLCKKYPVPTEAGGILEKISKCLKNHFNPCNYIQKVHCDTIVSKSLK